MGIDGIGGKPPPVSPPGATSGPGGVARPTEATRPFEVSRPAQATAPTGTAPVEAVRGPLERLRAGEIDLDGYLDAKVHEATAHLGPLPAPALENVRSALRDRLASDPTLVDLVRTATGKTPSLPED